MDTRFQEFVDDGIIPDSRDMAELLSDLSDVQTTMNALYHIYDVDPIDIEEFMYEDYMYVSMHKTFKGWIDEPPKPFFTRYPQIV